MNKEQLKLRITALEAEANHLEKLLKKERAEVVLLKRQKLDLIGELDKEWYDVAQPGSWC